MKDSRNPINPTETQEPITDIRKTRLRWLEIGLWLLAAVLGFVHVWADHHYLINADAMSYLDVAEAYLRRDWHTAINAYWSPLYSWLIALALFIVRPSSYWKFALLHLVNFAIYLFSLGCFSFLIHELMRLHRSLKDQLLRAGFVILPDWALPALGYPLFIWSSLYLIDISEESPDMLVASFVYLACGLLLRIRRQPSSLASFAWLGIVLGFGYLAKSVMLPMGLIFLAASMFPPVGWRQALTRISVTLVLFFLIGGPFAFAISQAKGRLTFGDSGRLNYLWAINQIPAPNWQGDEPGNGKPKHPTRKIKDEPPIFEFGEPVGGTYPVSYDPSYWYEGGVSRFNLRQQLRVVGKALQNYYEMFHTWGLQYGLLVGLLTLYLMGRRGWLLLYDWTSHWSLIVPAIAGLGLFALVNVQGRYVASFFVLLWLGLFSAVRLPDTPGSTRLIRSLTVVLMAIMIFTVVSSSGGEAIRTARQLVRGDDRTTHEQWQVAEGLREVGMGPGDKVAVIGNSFRAFWGQLLGVRVVADIQKDHVGSFWEADPTVKSEVIRTFAQTGAKAIVAERPPAAVDLNGWQKIRNTNYYVYLLKN